MDQVVDQRQEVEQNTSLRVREGRRTSTDVEIKALMDEEVKPLTELWCDVLTCSWQGWIDFPSLFRPSVQ